MRRAVRVWLSAGVLLLCGVARASAQTKVIDPYSLPMVQAACGGESESAPQGSVGSHGAEPALKPGLARVYVITETRGLFGKLGEPVRLGIDGHWFGVNHDKVYGYSYVDVTPGVHHLCVAARVRGVLPHTSSDVVLTHVDTVAGRSYYFTNLYIAGQKSLTLQPMDATVGAMYTSALPVSRLPKGWLKAGVNAWAELVPTHSNLTLGDLQACGIPGRHSAAPPAVPSASQDPSAAQLIVLLRSDIKRLAQRNAVNVGLDGHWAASLRSTSWVSVPIAPGQHAVCIDLNPLGGVATTIWSYGPEVYREPVEGAPGAKTYFETSIVNLGGADDGEVDGAMSQRIDPDEGALLVALYPRADAARP